MRYATHTALTLLVIIALGCATSTHVFTERVNTAVLDSTQTTLSDLAWAIEEEGYAVTEQSSTRLRTERFECLRPNPVQLNIEKQGAGYHIFAARGPQRLSAGPSEPSREFRVCVRLLAREIRRTVGGRLSYAYVPPSP